MRLLALFGVSVLLFAALALSGDVSAGEHDDPPTSGHALIITGASGNVVLVTGQAQPLTTPVTQCGYEARVEQLVQVLQTPCSFSAGGGCVGAARLVTTVIPPGRYTVTFVTYCPPYNIYRVDF